jgi:hypothetical protein
VVPFLGALLLVLMAVSYLPQITVGVVRHFGP